MQVHCVFATELDVLDDFDQNFVSAFLKSRGVAEIVFHFGARRRPLQTIGRIFGFLDGKGRTHRADYGHLGTNRPTHDAAGLLTYPFDARH